MSETQAVAEGVVEVATETGNLVANEIDGLINVMKDFNIIGFALGVLMANAGADFANAIIDGIIMPTLKPIIDRVTPKGKASLRIGSIEIDLEKLLQALIKFFALVLVVYLLIKVGIKMNKPVQWVSVRSVAEGVSLS
jgi:large-conductance mechanosensitive channel|tara:strand:+ start:148 stop:561 length:414 start_codon:yes stop_codon:yes gene_type:complete